MTEIRFDVDLDHPPERVWRALTDPRHLGDWFLPAEVDPGDGTRLRFCPDRMDGLAGPIDVEVVDTEAPTRFVTRWQGEDLHVRVVITITPVADGSRLTFVQRGFLGRRGTLRRRVLRTTYGRLFGERLPRALDRIAGQEPTVRLVAKVPPPPGNAGSALRSTGRRNDGGFRGRWVRRCEMRVVPEQATQPAPGRPAGVGVPRGAIPAQAGPHPAETGQAVGVVAAGWSPPTSHRAAGAAHRAASPAHRGGGGQRGVATVPGTRGAATGRAAVPSASAWLAAQPAGRRHRAVAVPYQHGAGTRSIRRFIAVRPISEEPTLPLHAAGARRRRDVVSHGSAPLVRRLLAGLGPLPGRAGTWRWAIPRWISERRGAAMAAGAAVLLVATMAAVMADRMTVPRRPAPPRVGGAAEPPPGFGVVPGRAGAQLPGGTQPSRGGGPSLAVPAAASPPPPGAPAPLAGSYRTVDAWIGGYRGEVTIDNRADTSVDGWSSTITLPLPGLTVGSVRGAESRQSGRVVTFTPTGDTASVPARGAVRFDFIVDGAGRPTGCTLDDHACDGLPG